MPQAATAEQLTFLNQPARSGLRLIARDGELVAGGELIFLESAHYKGHLLVERLTAEADGATEFAEGVDGAMFTEFELEYRDGDLFDEHGRSMDEATLNGIESAEEAAADNPELKFEVPRRHLNRQEYLHMLAMAEGRAPNTMVVTSDLPWHLHNAKKDIGGYNITRKQTMEQVSFLMPKREDGRIFIKLQTHTLDGSNRKGHDAIYDDLDEKLGPGEALSQRIYKNLTYEQQTGLMKRIVGVYDQSMTEQFGGGWYAGRRPADYRNTYDFVLQQKDIINAYVEAKLGGTLTRDMMYDLIATMQERFEKNAKAQKLSKHVIEMLPADFVYTQKGGVWQALKSAGTALWDEVGMAGRAARKAGKTFSACGDTLTADGDNVTAEGGLANSRYGKSGGSSH